MSHTASATLRVPVQLPRSWSNCSPLRDCGWPSSVNGLSRSAWIFDREPGCSQPDQVSGSTSDESGFVLFQRFALRSSKAPFLGKSLCVFGRIDVSCYSLAIPRASIEHVSRSICSFAASVSPTAFYRTPAKSALNPLLKVVCRCDESGMCRDEPRFGGVQARLLSLSPRAWSKLCRAW